MSRASVTLRGALRVGLATTVMAAGPVCASAQQRASLEDFAFLTGCWEGR